MITNVKFVSIPTTDQDRALEFYTQKLGFVLVTDQPFDGKQRWIEMRVGKSDTRVVLFDMGDDAKRAGTPFNGALASDNLERTYEELKARGVEFVTEPQKEDWGMFAVFKDPDGNTFVLSSR